MCGIVGIVSQSAVASRLIEGLRRLEYRGYDSAGIAVMDSQSITRFRKEGKLSALENFIHNETIPQTIGIGHTRWATHGVANECNAHPHGDETIAVVHNGIIENFSILKKELIQKGYIFKSQTDTEVVAFEFKELLKIENDPLKAFHQLLQKLEGTYALAIMIQSDPTSIYFARQGSPLVLGIDADNNERMLGSDALALATWTQKICYLDEGDFGRITSNDWEIYNVHNEKVDRIIQTISLTGEMIGKGQYRHFMLKEIHEQPTALTHTLASFFKFEDESIHIPHNIPFDTFSKITIIACGTSYYAGMLAKYWIEKHAQVAVDIDIASEYRYRSPVISKNDLAIVISQSGETIDTLSALKHIKDRGQKVLAIVNVKESSMARQADWVLYTQAGPEIGVASTKAFTSQLAALAALTIRLTHYKNPTKAHAMTHELLKISSYAQHILSHESDIQTVATYLQDVQACLFIGRGEYYPIVLEGALKLKELSYIHASAYAAGELKHGPIALVDAHTPIIVVAPHDHLFEKTASNIQEILARGGQVYCFTDEKGHELLADMSPSLTIVSFPSSQSWIDPLLMVIPLQLLAYHTALIRGTDVDQPRNLAKSVTVE
jgi:glucosamine--fructose-6-phosphate aminotransferase (isomerizing)